MKTDEHEKSMNADPEDIDGDPDTDIVKNQAPLSAAASQIQGRGNQTAPAGPPPAGPVMKSFTSVSLSKAHGSPCAPKPTSEDKGPMWVGGKTSKEVPREEEGQYTPPGWSDKDDEDDKKKDVKKSFVSAQLSKAEGTTPPKLPKAKPAAPKAGYGWANKPPQTSTQNLTYLPDDRWDTGYEEKTASPQAKKVVKKSFVSAQLSKADPRAAQTVKVAKDAINNSMFKVLFPGGIRTPGYKKPAPPGKRRRSDAGVLKDSEATLKRQKIQIAAARGKIAAAKGRAATPPPTDKLKGGIGDLPPVTKVKMPEKKKLPKIEDPKKITKSIPVVGPALSASKKVEDPEEPLRLSLTELRYGSQLARNHDIGKSCGVCGRISKSCGDHEDGGCCEDCKKSMSSVNWHDSHLS